MPTAIAHLILNLKSRKQVRAAKHTGNEFELEEVFELHET